MGSLETKAQAYSILTNLNNMYLADASHLVMVMGLVKKSNMDVYIEVMRELELSSEAVSK